MTAILWQSFTHGADTQVNTLEILSTVDVETLVNDTTLLTRLHRTRSQTVPGGLNVIYDIVSETTRQSLIRYAPAIQSSIALSSSSVYLMSS